MLAPTHPLQLVLGLTVWSVWFVAWYGGLSVACAVAEPANAEGPATWINLVLTLFSAAVAALLLVWAKRSWRALKQRHLSRAERVITSVGVAGHLAAAVSVVAMNLPAWVYPPCV